MPITLLEYSKRLDGVVSDLQTGAHGQVMTQIASNAIMMIRGRVLEKGLNPSGGTYGDYSPGYLKQKQKAGKYKGFVNFSFTNRMWDNLKLVSDKAELDTGVAVIKETTPLESNKLAWNTERRGDILALSDDEKRRLVVDYEQGILNIWRKNKLL